MNITGAREPSKDYPPAPHLVWPVSRREFYRAIWVAMLPALTWGIILFGFRSLAMLVAAVAAVSATHMLFKRGLRWKRAQALMYQHSLVSAFVLVGLAHPTWPVWVVGAAAGILPLLLVFIGGAGRERIHVSVALALLIQYVAVEQMIRLGIYQEGGEAILARDRLVMGDIHDQHTVPTLRWPISLELAGHDALRFPPPAQVAADTLNRVSHMLPARGTERGHLSERRAEEVRKILDGALALDLPAMDAFALGLAPNRLGAASLIAITLGGLFLSYRYVLRPRSVLLFLITFIVASYLLAFTPPTVYRAGLPALWEVVRRFPGEILTLTNFLLLNSDAPFTAVFILALPGTEPLTARGRWYFLLLAAVLAAAIHRLDPLSPAAALVLCVLMPIAPAFDRLLAERSWLDS